MMDSFNYISIVSLWYILYFHLVLTIFFYNDEIIVLLDRFCCTALRKTLIDRDEFFYIPLFVILNFTLILLLLCLP